MHEDFVTLAEAAKLIPGRPSTTCLWRWCREGLKARSGYRVYLEHRRIGGQIYTRPDWLQAFFQALTDADRKHFVESPQTAAQIRPNSAKRDREIEDADKEVQAILG